VAERPAVAEAGCRPFAALGTSMFCPLLCGELLLVAGSAAKMPTAAAAAAVSPTAPTNARRGLRRAENSEAPGPMTTSGPSAVRSGRVT
jgi:hypothetical protein